MGKWGWGGINITVWPSEILDTRAFPLRSLWSESQGFTWHNHEVASSMIAIEQTRPPTYQNSTWVQQYWPWQLVKPMLWIPKNKSSDVSSSKYACLQICTYYLPNLNFTWFACFFGLPFSLNHEDLKLSETSVEGHLQLGREGDGICQCHVDMRPNGP